MHLSHLAKPLSASLGTFSSAWQKALQHFQRALLECGSSLELEHSQRLGILFSKDVGSTSELQRWSSLFTAEDVPACSLFLKALVYHGQWETAVKMLEQNAQHKTAGDLTEYLAQFLVANNLWEQSLASLEKMCIHGPHDNSETDALLTVSSSYYASALSTSFKDESKEMATNPRFVPEEEQPVYCGIGATAFRAFPKNRDWEKALRLMDKGTNAVSPDIRLKILEYKAARFIYGAKKNKEYLEWARKNWNICRKSPTLSRFLFYCALESGDVETCVNCLEFVQNNKNNTLSSRSANRFATLFIIYYKDNCPLKTLETFRSFLRANQNTIVDASTKKQVVFFFKTNGMEFSFGSSSNLVQSAFAVLENTATCFLERTQQLSETGKPTVTEIDKFASLLLRENKWKEALMCLESVKTVTALSESEVIIKNNIIENATNWEKALLFCL